MDDPIKKSLRDRKEATAERAENLAELERNLRIAFEEFPDELQQSIRIVHHDLMRMLYMDGIDPRSETFRKTWASAGYILWNMVDGMTIQFGEDGARMAYVVANTLLTVGLISDL